MTQLRHPNIVVFLGACTIRGSEALVFEYMKKGSLANLMKKQELSLAYKYKVALDCANG